MDISELAMLLEATDTNEVTSDEFEHACETAKHLPHLIDEQRLQLYGLYKQSTVGDVNVPRPMALNMVGTAKWDAWKSFEGFPMKAAAKAYVYLVGTCSTSDTEKNSTGNGGDENVFTSLGAMMGVGGMQYGEDIAENKWNDQQKIFHAVTEGNLDELEVLLKENVDVNSKDQEGMTPLHYAIDRSLLDMVNLLIKYNADLDAQDQQGETPLMLAVMCEHIDMVSLLTGRGARKDIQNNEGMTALDLCETDELRSLLS